MKVAKGPSDVKVGDLVEFDPRPASGGYGVLRGTVEKVRDLSITVRCEDGKVRTSSFKANRKIMDGWCRKYVEVYPISVIEPRDLWLARRPACVVHFGSVVEIAIGKFPRGPLGADAFAAIAREVEEWLREEPTP